MANGGSAAEIAACRFVESIVEGRNGDSTTRITRAAEAANAEVHRVYEEKGGTTLVAVLQDSTNSFVGVSAGDSRMYTLSGKMRVEQVSTDDTIAGEVQRFKGGGTQADEANSAARELAQYVGMGPGMQPRTYEIRPDQAGAIVLCTDGIHSIPARTFEQVVIHAPTPYKMGTRLIQISEWLGGFDNGSLIIIPSALKSPLRQNAETRDDSIEVWHPFGKMNVLNWEGTRTAYSQEQRGPQYVEPATAKSDENRSARGQRFKPGEQPAPERKQEKKRGTRKREKRKPAPQIGMELIENSGLELTRENLDSNQTPNTSENDRENSATAGNAVQPADAAAPERNGPVPSSPQDDMGDK